MSKIKKYFDSKGKILAMVIPSDYKGGQIDFLTQNEDYQQIAYMHHPKNHIIIPHYHNKIDRTISFTTETLVMRSGKLEVTLYEDEKPIYTFNILGGDIVTLFSGGHGFKVIEEVEMIEIKQGPFMGPNDKTRF